MTQDRAGFMLTCTEHGIFAYDGRRFVNLGPDQGLRQGGYVKSIALTEAGRVAVGFADEVFVSNQAPDPSHPPSDLWFRPVLHPGVTFYDERVHRLASWRDGLVLIAGSTTERIVVPNGGPARIETMGYDLGEQALLTGAVAVFSVDGNLWETFEDGRICAANPGTVKCYAAANGLSGGAWVDIIGAPGGRILARSASSVASFDPSSGRWSVVELPDQGGRYLNYRDNLRLFWTPDGSLVTQADHGLAVLGPQGWRVLTVEDGAPPGIIMSAMTDATGQLWFQVFGRGLMRWIGQGHWQSVQKAEGLSEGIVWMTARSPEGRVWVSTDTGVDEVVHDGSSLRVSKVFPGASFAIAAGPRGQLWRGYGADGVRVTDPATGSETKVAVPPVNAMLASPGDIMWLGTERGLYRIDDRPGVPYRAVLQGPSATPVVDVVSDTQGGVFYLAGGRLRHMHADGNDLPIAGAWPTDGFEPHAMAVAHDGTMWICGAGGLFHAVLSADRVLSYERIPTAATRTNTIASVMIDHRGWVWAGTALGLSVFNQHRWVSVDSERGMVWDDVDEGGIREDPDGSVWITTSRGVSHLLDPDWLFADQPIKVVVSGALLGSNPVTGGQMPYTRDALSLTFGTPSYGAERSVQFRYSMSGVDTGWAESMSGVVRYPVVPPGHHILTVFGRSELTNQSSPPITLVVDIAFPWWRQWWSETLWALAAAGLAYAAMRLRFHALLARQAELQHHVAQATEQLRYQAAHDSLTGLLNRREIEERLASKLSSGSAGDEMIVALVDVDNFKRVNDTYGHLGGDDVLRAMGRLVRKAVAAGEYAGRYGGEEILLVLDDSDGRGAERVLDLHHVIRGGTFNAAGQSIRVTCSIGLAWAVPGDDWESLIGRADDALYVAKASGRDQVVESGRADAAMHGARSERRLTPGSSLASD